MQRGDYWLDEVCARHLGVHGKTYANNDPFFFGRMQHTARAYVERHLNNPALTPAGCARAIGVSLRALHMAFEPSGESFSQFLQRRRLERCHALLRNQAAASRPVADIAFSSACITRR